MTDERSTNQIITDIFGLPPSKRECALITRGALLESDLVRNPRHGSERNYLWRPTLPSHCLSAMCPMPTNSSRVL